MPTVPLAGESPTVEGRIAPPSYFSPTDNSAAFGAGVAQAGAGLGNALEQVGDTGNKIATDLAIQADIRASKDADAAHMGYVSQLGYKGDGTPQNPNGYYAMRGEQALAYQPIFEAAIRAQAQQQAEGMAPRAANMFLNSAALRNQGEIDTSMKFSMLQNLEANKIASSGRMEAATAGAVNTWNDPVKTEAAAQIIRGETASQMVGQPQEAIDAATQQRISKLYADNINMALGAGDINTAARLFSLYGPQMDATTHVQVQERMHGPVLTATATAAVNAALGRSTTIGDGSMPSTGGAADKTLPPEQQAFLNTLSGPESAGKYNVRYTPNGGATFSDLSQHPNIPEPTKDGQTSTAAGRYQFLNSTYAPIATKLGLTDFSPVSQDRAAMDLASTTYKDKTGRDLAADLKEGGHATDIAGALNKVWPSLPGGSQVGTTLAKFTSGLSQLESGPSARSVAAATTVHPDFSAAADKLVAQFGGDAELLYRSMTILRQQESIYNLGVKTQQEGLRKSLGDTAAALADGRDDVPIPELAIRHAFDPAVADQMVDKLHEAQLFGQTYKQVQFMSPEDYQAQREVLASSLGAKAAAGTSIKGQVAPGNTDLPQAPSDVAGYAQRQKELATLDAAWKQRTERLTADPAAYTRSAPSVAAAYAAIDPRNPATIEAAVNASKAAQISMGVDPSSVRTLTNATVGDLVKKLHTIDPKDGDMGAQLDQMAKQYGGAWPGVMHDLVTQGHLSPAYQMLGAMDDPSQAGPRQNLQRALQDQAVKGDRFGSAVPALQKQPLEQGIDNYLSPFRDSTVNGGGALFTGVVMPAVKTLATFYAEQGQDGDTAAKMATDQIINSKYEFSGATRVPKTFDGKPLGINAVLAAGNGVTANLADADLAHGEGSFTAKEARQGIWAPNPDESGVTLLARKSGGFGYQVVKDKDSKPISMGFGNLPKATGPTASEMIPGAMN